VIGVISDTHGLMRPEALAALAGSELIIHAGDVGAPAVLEALQEIAPVITVRKTANPALSLIRIALEEVQNGNKLMIWRQDGTVLREITGKRRAPIRRSVNRRSFHLTSVAAIGRSRDTTK
jgi:hypothetical protein